MRLFKVRKAPLLMPTQGHSCTDSTRLLLDPTPLFVRLLLDMTPLPFFAYMRQIMPATKNVLQVAKRNRTRPTATFALFIAFEAFVYRPRSSSLFPFARANLPPRSMPDGRFFCLRAVECLPPLLASACGRKLPPSSRFSFVDSCAHTHSIDATSQFLRERDSFRFAEKCGRECHGM